MKAKLLLIGMLVVGTAMTAACLTTSGSKPSETESSAPDTAKTLVAAEAMIIHGYEWGPAVDKITVRFAQNIAPSDITNKTFSVTCGTAGRTITDVFVSDMAGNSQDAAAPYVTFEFTVKSGEASPFVYDYRSGRNVWVSEYSVTLQLTENASITISDKTYTPADFGSVTMDFMPVAVKPETDNLKKGTYTGLDTKYPKESTNPSVPENTTLQLAAYEPETLRNDGMKNPLIIWLHGAGEGGSDVDIALLGNEVTALYKEEIQSKFATDGGGNGIYVLAVQTPTCWMDNGNSKNHSGNEYSRYSDVLMGAIKKYVSDNGDIDLNRIYIGGCSNGGYMTINLMLKYGDYFAAAYPVCEAYMDSFITDDQIKTLAKYSMWFVHSADDPVVIPTSYAEATYARLIQAGASNCWFSLFETVKGTDDPTAAYLGHFSWIYFFNDQVTKVQVPSAVSTDAGAAGNFGMTPSNAGGGTASAGYATIFDWLNAQHK